jgi:hypothetical protein
MFFIGATGPLVTVIITLVLPFMLLFTQKPAPLDEIRLTNPQVVQNIVASPDNSIHDSGQTFFQAFNVDSGIKTFLSQIKINKSPILDQPFIKLLFTLSNSGNKAPPVSFI